MRTLLLAEESITVQRVIALTFADEAIRVVAVADGQRAIERMAAELPDIVLAGTTLPQVSGYDLAKFMRGNAELRMVPVLLLSGAFETVDEVRLVASGANGLIEKPVEPTNVINRVKELLGLKSDPKPATIGRLVTPTSSSKDTRLPKAPPLRPVTSTRPARPLPPASPASPTPPAPPAPLPWDKLREQTGLEASSPAVEDSSTRTADYLDTLDSAFESLDEQLSGRTPGTKDARNPAGPLRQSGSAADPRSPGRTPPPAGESVNPVFEVDDEWFGGAESQAQADARAGRREIAEDLRAPELQAPKPPEAGVPPVFEVDEGWFAGNEKSRAGVTPIVEASAKPSDVGIDEVRAAAAKVASSSSGEAENITALPAVEREERTEAPVVALPPPEVKFVTPEITDELLDQIATRVADRLSAGEFGAQLKDAMTATMRATVRDSVHTVVSEISERLVRETVPTVAAEAVERIVRDTVPMVVTEVSGRLVGEAVPAVVAEAVERIVRDTVPMVVTEVSGRLVGEAVPAVVAETSEHLIREAVPAVVREASERAVGAAVATAVNEATERIVRDAVPTVVAETSERVVRETVPAVVNETAERHVRDAVRPVVSETSERLVRAEIERIKSGNLDQA